MIALSLNSGTAPGRFYANPVLVFIVKGELRNHHLWFCVLYRKTLWNRWRRNSYPSISWPVDVFLSFLLSLVVASLLHYVEKFFNRDGAGEFLRDMLREVFQELLGTKNVSMQGSMAADVVSAQ